MSFDFLIILACCILALMAHGCRYKAWLEWVLRTIIVISFAGELFSVLAWLLSLTGKGWEFFTLAVMAASTGAILFHPVRVAFSNGATAMEILASGQFIAVLYKKINWQDSFNANKIFVPTSMPHLVALWIYLSSLWFLLGSISPKNFALPDIPIAIPVAIDQLFAYNGLGLVLLSACGVGIFIARKPTMVLECLAVLKPTGRQVIIGISIVVMSFLYDYIWSIFTHQTGGGLATKLTNYNAGSFTAGGGLQGSTILALATGLCAGIGEETLMRGALQPVFGILPAAILHGLLHGQFSHAPIFIVQVAGWSTIMGIIKRYTNTSTTMIGHVLYNFALTFLFAFNP